MSERQPKILIIDDLPMVRSGLKYILKSLGYDRVEEASDGYDALGLLKAEAKADRFDVIFCDYVMPYMDGMAFLKRIKCEKLLVGTPVIMITAERDKSSGLLAIREGAKDYVMKPLVPKNIDEKMSSLFNGKVIKAA